MIGAIAGDVIGSIFEHYAIKSTQFPLFSPYSRFTDSLFWMFLEISLPENFFTINGQSVY